MVTFLIHENVHEKMAVSTNLKRGVIISCGAVVAVLAIKKSLSARIASPDDLSNSATKKKSPNKPLKSTMRFWRIIFRLLRPYGDGHLAKLVIAMLGCTFVFAVVDVRKAFVSGQLFKAVFEGNNSSFKKLLLVNILLSVVLTVFNKVLANLVSSLGRHWHKKLVDRIHDLYFAGNNYYQIQNLIELPHERLANDAPQLTRDMALITCDFINALINFLVFSRQVYSFGKRISGDKAWSGARLVLGPVSYAMIGSLIVARFIPNLGFVRKTQRELESKYKQSHVRLCRNSEAVALYSGEDYEKSVIEKHFGRLTAFNENVRWAAMPSELIKEYITKYALHTCMMMLVLSPFFNPNDPSKGKSAGQAMYRIKVLSELIVMELIALSQLARLGNTIQRVSGLVERVGELVHGLDEIEVKAHAPDARGTTSDKSIQFNNVSIHTPSGHKLVAGLTFTIKPGENFLICGPNGAGKSSILRCLGGLWPIEEGNILRPSGDGLGLHADAFYLPQRPYIPAYSTLAQCITYPDMHDKIEEKQLSALLRLVELDYLYKHLKESSALEHVFQWDSRLSLGEQQRLAIARLFYHRPVYAVLDECTSGVSLKMERRLFKLCRELGITLITISHRPALQDFHQKMLVLDGAGGYQIHDLPSKPENQLTHSISTRSLSDVNTAMRHYAFDKILARLERSGSVALLHDPTQSQTESEGDISETDRAQKDPSTVQLDTLRLWRSSLFIIKTCWNPRDVSKAVVILGLVVVRTYISNSLAGISGDSFRYLVKGRHSDFIKVIGTALLMGFLQALFMPMLDVMEGDLSDAWRSRITGVIMNSYLKKKRFYALSVQGKSSSLTGPSVVGSEALVLPDQIIVDDVESLTRSVANLWGEFAKPAVDFLWFSSTVFRLTGWTGLGSLGIYMVGGSLFLSSIRPDLAGLSARKEQLDGEFLTVHARLSQCSESISFLEGGAAERNIIETYLNAKIDHQKQQKRIEHIFGVPDQFVTFFLPQSAGWILSMMYKASNSQVTGDILIRDLRYLGSVVNQCFSSLGVLVQLGTMWASTRGHLERVASLIDQLEDSDEISCNIRSDTNSNCTLGIIRLEDCDVIPPAGDTVLVRGLSFILDPKVDKGMMLAGFNGSGKSSVLKLMRGLLKAGRGTVSTCPDLIHFVPTKPYLAEGFLADQVTYPLKAKEDRDHEEIISILRTVKIAYLDERDNGIFGSHLDSWDTKLSLGEQQRLGIGRLLFHAKRNGYAFAMLDECTSAVALDGEEEMYKEIQSLGLCCVTASQKPWLLQFHSRIIQLAEGAKWESCHVDPEDVTAESTRLPDIVYQDARQSASVQQDEDIENGVEMTAVKDTPPARALQAQGKKNRRKL